jgi:catechol 2,3-dioxygenase-like lactoylglutathione lyase family enzyme
VRFEHIGIYARNVDALAKWYCDVLGLNIVRKLEKTGRPPIYFLASPEGFEIEILPSAAERKQREVEEPGFSHIGIVVQDFNETVSHLQSKGTAPFGVRRTSNNWQIGYVKDPEGNVLEIVKR